jgi:hypothetical protein
VIKTPKHPNDTLPLPPHWAIQENPTVVDVIRISFPPLIIVFTARHTLLGDHAHVIVHADLPKLLQLSTAKKEREKQSRHALRRLKKAIIMFSNVTPLPSSLRGPLFELPWARKSFKSKLLFTGHNK